MTTKRTNTLTAINIPDFDWTTFRSTCQFVGSEILQRRDEMRITGQCLNSDSPVSVYHILIVPSYDPLASLLFASNCRDVTKLEWPNNVRMYSPVSIFHIFIELSNDPLASLLFASNCNDDTLLVWPINVRIHNPLWKFHICIDWSHDPLASLLLGSNCSDETISEWPVNSRKHSPVSTFQIVIVNSCIQLASLFLELDSSLSLEFWFEKFSINSLCSSTFYSAKMYKININT